MHSEVYFTCSILIISKNIFVSKRRKKSVVRGEKVTNQYISLFDITNPWTKRININHATSYKNVLEDILYFSNGIIPKKNVSNKQATM